MDHGSRFFYALEKMRGAKKHVTCLLAEDGTPLTAPVEMCGRARAFYASLFSLDPTDPGACRVLWEELPTVSVSDQDQLELPLTLAEFSEALRRMPTNKSPGMDGLTVEFYRVFWDILGLDLVTVWAESLQSRVLPLSCRRAVLATAEEGGPPRFTKLASRLAPQHGLQNRSESNLAVARVLYASTECLVKLNWTLTELVSFGQGVQQGCPLSGQLDTPAIEPFLCLLHRRLTGLVLWEPELQLVLSVYADDVLLVVQDSGDLAQVQACQTIYSAASSARVNWVKSSGLTMIRIRMSRTAKMSSSSKTPKEKVHTLN
ncbi:unnamed protein product [Caretta caretta]